VKIASVFLPSNYWKFDSIMKFEDLKMVLQNANLFNDLLDEE
jgi:hypothetical protein